MSDPIPLSNAALDALEAWELFRESRLVGEIREAVGLPQEPASAIYHRFIHSMVRMDDRAALIELGLWP